MNNQLSLQDIDDIEAGRKPVWTGNITHLCELARQGLIDKPVIEGVGVDGFEIADFADLHKSFMEASNDKVTSALLSNNYNVILAALKRCAQNEATS